MVELKPCPMCGKADKVEIDDELGDVELIVIRCGRCFVEVKSLWVKETIKRWNRRPPDDRPGWRRKPFNKVWDENTLD